MKNDETSQSVINKLSLSWVKLRMLSSLEKSSEPNNSFSSPRHILADCIKCKPCHCNCVNSSRLIYVTISHYQHWLQMSSDLFLREGNQFHCIGAWISHVYIYAPINTSDNTFKSKGFTILSFCVMNFSIANPVNFLNASEHKVACISFSRSLILQQKMLSVTCWWMLPFSPYLLAPTGAYIAINGNILTKKPVKQTKFYFL